jgi:hypothetical protein
LPFIVRQGKNRLGALGFIEGSEQILRGGSHVGYGGQSAGWGHGGSRDLGVKSSRQERKDEGCRAGKAKEWGGHQGDDCGGGCPVVARKFRVRTP